MADDILTKKRITEYEETATLSTLRSDDMMFVDGQTLGTRKMSLLHILNNLFKSSGVSVTDANYSTTITDVNNQPVNTIYTYAANLQSKISNLPSNFAVTILHYTPIFQASTAPGQIMLAIERTGDNKSLYFRTTSGSPAAWSAWQKVTNGSDVEAAITEALNNFSVETDKTLSVENKPADAKAAGDAINDVKADLNKNVARITKLDGIIDISSIDTELGYYSVSNNEIVETSGNSWIRAINPIHLEAGAKIGFDSADTSIQFKTCYLQDGSDTYGTNDFRHYTLTINNAGTYYLTFRYNPSVNFNDNPEKKDELLDLFYVKQANYIEKDALIYRGNMSSLGYTTFAQCVEIGYYNFAQAYLSSITDKPSDLTTGGILIYYGNYAGETAYRRIITNGKEYYKVGSGTWVKTVDNDGEYTYRGNMSDLGYTAFSQCAKDGYYNFGQSYLASITDKPDGIVTGGMVKVYTHFAGGTVFRILFDDAGNQWIKVNVADWKRTVVASTVSDTVWYAFGDSITRGTYSYIEGGEEKSNLTNRNYVYWASQRNGFKVTNYGQGASGYLHQGEFGTNGKEVVDSIDFSECNLVTFAWGVNDWHYNQSIGTVNDDKSLGTTMASNMKYCIEKVLTDNPLCKLIILLPMNCSRYGGDFNSDWGLGTSLTTSGTLQHVIDVIKGIAEYYHLQVIDQSNTSVVNRVNINDCLPDGIHPSLDTYKQLGLNIAKQIQFA